MEEQQNQQQAYLKEALERGVAFEEMTNSKGWKFVMAYIESQIKQLATDILTSDQPITEFETKRRSVMGLRKLLSHVESDLNTLKAERKKNEQPKSE